MRLTLTIGQPVGQFSTRLGVMKCSKTIIPQRQGYSEIAIMVLFRNRMMNLMLCRRHYHLLQWFPVSDGNGTVAQIGTEQVEYEVENTGTEYGHQRHLLAKEKEKQADTKSLHQCTAQSKNDTFQRMRTQYGNRIKRRGTVVNLVE